MIITCPNCKKQFRIDQALIPVNGRDLKCGSCEYVWFFKIEEKKSKILSLSEDIISNEDKSVLFEEEKEQIIKKQSLSQNITEIKGDKNNSKIIDKQITTNNTNKENSSSKFFSYLIVSVISFVALIILVDTLKLPLINVFPGLEIILFNLFEILKDIKLFIIDLY